MSHQGSVRSVRKNFVKFVVVSSLKRSLFNVIRMTIIILIYSDNRVSLHFENACTIA